jgi:hypothetical protein
VFFRAWVTAVVAGDRCQRLDLHSAKSGDRCRPGDDDRQVRRTKARVRSAWELLDDVALNVLKALVEASVKQVIAQRQQEVGEPLAKSRSGVPFLHRVQEGQQGERRDSGEQAHDERVGRDTADDGGHGKLSFLLQ